MRDERLKVQSANCGFVLLSEACEQPLQLNAFSPNPFQKNNRSASPSRRTPRL